MDDAEAIQILARWVYELQRDRRIATTRIDELHHRTRLLEQRLRARTHWTTSGLTRQAVHDAARELDPTVIG